MLNIKGTHNGFKCSSQPCDVTNEQFEMACQRLVSLTPGGEMATVSHAWFQHRSSVLAKDNRFTAVAVKASTVFMLILTTFFTFVMESVSLVSAYSVRCPSFSFETF